MVFSLIDLERTNEMRNEMTMYALKPIVSLPRALHHTKTMYEMRNIHEERSTDDHTEAESKIVPDITEQIPMPEYGALEARQEKILAQLAELKKQVSTLCDFLKQTNQVAVVNKSHNSHDPVSVNLVINVNPERPPYFISALQKVWKDTDIKVQTYVHSSINTEGPIVYQPTTNSTDKNVINLSLIWKDVEDLELISSLQGYRITGDTNFLRYISRLLSSHNYETSVCSERVNTVDFILDLCHSLHFQDSLKKKQEILSLIADRIETNWSDKGKPDIADIAAWCTIKQVFPKKYPSKLNKWFEACEKSFV